MLSIVIPCRNGSRTLASQLDAILAQATDLPIEIIVADNGSTDTTAELVQTFHAHDDRVRLVSAHGTIGINHGRNVGIRAANGQYILLCDADDLVQPGWLAGHAQAFTQGALCVGGGVEFTLDDGTVIDHIPGVVTVNWDVPSPIGANCGFRREVFDGIGGFDESFRGGGDETDFFWRAHAAGFPTTAVPDALVSYALRSKLSDVARQFFGYGLGTVALYVAHRTWGMPRSRWWQAPVVIAIAAAQLVAPDPRRRRKAVERIAVRAGRLVGSVRHRTMYL
ncbi:MULTISPECIES: glycosyltransferase family 2 protein [unclassified Plantibacter]|uniref:glycosyltransferase family 2 protein n=1 Tax=unclassified Plantibacter TaxID=2624265 RepID=UPI00177E4DEA|nr:MULTISPECIES: glycosyltransferase [unclassified Plantibacter]MBD8516604.1 glycosyltransferase [Plantibacter sp. CFBP 8804]